MSPLEKELEDQDREPEAIVLGRAVDARKALALELRRSVFRLADGAAVGRPAMRSTCAPAGRWAPRADLPALHRACEAARPWGGGRSWRRAVGPGAQRRPAPRLLCRRGRQALRQFSHHLNACAVA